MTRLTRIALAALAFAALCAACTPATNGGSGMLPATTHHQLTPLDSGGGLPPHPAPTR
jgi:hypothetical protein